MPYADPVKALECARRANAKYRKNHPDRDKASHTKYYRENREKVLEYWKNKRIANRDEFLKWEAEYRAANRETLSAQARAWYHANHEENRKKKRAYYHSNRAAARAYQRKYVAENYDTKMRAKALARWRRYRDSHPHAAQIQRSKRKARKLSVLVDSTADVFYRFVRSRNRISCYYCGKSVSGKKAHIDHVIALSKSGNHTSSNLCASCPRCNLSKHARPLTEWIPKTGQPLLNF